MKGVDILLDELDACFSAREWAIDKTIEQIVAECDRGDWLLWLGEMVEVDQRKLIFAWAYCANTIRNLLQPQQIDAIDKVTSERVLTDNIRMLKTIALSADVYAAADARAKNRMSTAAARAKNRMLTADICRDYIGQEIINIVNSKLQQQ